MQTPSVDTVRRLLSTLAPADASEAQSLQRIRELIDTASAPFSRDHFAPGHLTASAIVFDETREHTLLIFHSKLQLWLQPGGHFEPGENDPSVAAAREVLEETGLSCLPPDNQAVLHDVDVHAIPARKADPLHYHFDLRMLLISPRVAAQIGDGVSAVRWVSRAEFEGMKLDPGLVRALRKIWK